jgi:phage terminase large subunit GpA-like protein
MTSTNTVKISDLGYWDQVLAAFKPPEKISGSEWANRYRILTEISPEPGPYRTSRTPYAKQPMDDFSDPEIEHIVLCFSTQVGKTEIIYNCLGYAIDQDPSSAMLVMPTDKAGHYVSLNRIQPMIEASERLRDKKHPDRNRWSLFEMAFVGGMVLSIAGANSPTDLSSKPIRYLFRDEVDKYGLWSGKEADPMSLSWERTKNFWNRKIFDVSTPTTEEGNITKELKTCDTVSDFEVPCPFCGQYQVMFFEQIKWPHGDDGHSVTPEEAERTAWYECESCREKITDLYKPQMLRMGRWKPRGNVRPLHPKKVGYHLPSWYSPWVTFGQCAKEWLSSKDFPEKLMNFVNSWKAEPWSERVATKTTMQLMANRNDLDPLVVPQDAIGLTAGIDPSGGLFYVAVVAWTWDLSPHLVYYGVLPDWDRVRIFAWETYYTRDVTGVQIQIFRVGLDTGGSKYDAESQTMTAAAYDFLRDNGGNRIFGTKGERELSGSNHLRLNKVGKMPGKYGALIPGELPIWHLDTSGFKDIIHYRLDRPEGEKGRFTFHRNTQADFMRHILAEEKRRDRTGKYYWYATSRINHWLDCLVIAFAMADPECGGGVRVIPLPEPEPRSPSEARESWIGKRGGKWV